MLQSRKFQYINLNELLELIGHDQDTLLVLIEEFLESSEGDMNSLGNAISKADFVEISEAAHKMKATFKYFNIKGADEMVLLETGAKNKSLSLDEISLKFGELKEYFKGAFAEIENLKNTQEW